MKHTRTHGRQRGLTIIECSVAATVVSVLVGIAAPSFERAMQRRHLEGTAAQLATDIQFTRSLAQARSQSLRITWTSDSSRRCYMIHTGSATDCTCNAAGAAVCNSGAQAFKTANSLVAAPTTLSSNSTSMLFDPTRGTVTPTATWRVENLSGDALHVVVNIFGRVRTCAAAGTVPGYRSC